MQRAERGRREIYQIWAGLLYSWHIFFIVCFANMKSPIYVLSQMLPALRNQQIRLDDDHVACTMSWGGGTYCQGPGEAFRGKALEMRFDQHGLARRMVTKEKNRLAPKPRSFTKRSSVPKAHFLEVLRLQQGARGLTSLCL